MVGPGGEKAADVLLELELSPARNIGRLAVLILLLAVAAVALVLAIAFAPEGVRPMLGFLGLHLLALYLILRLNFPFARVREFIRLTADELAVERRRGNRPVERWSFNPYWVRLSFAPGRGIPDRLLLRSHGQALALGDFLNTEERWEIAPALNDALFRARSNLPA